MKSIDRSIANISSGNKHHFIAMGTFFCLLSDILFGLSSFFLRGLTVYHVSADWILMIKELIVASAAVCVLCFYRDSKRLFPGRKILMGIFLIAFFGETVGLRSLISGYGYIGIVLANPIIRTFTILGSLVLGAVFLREKINRIRWFAVILLIAALFLLSFGQSATDFDSVLTDMENKKFLIGFFFAALAGSGYAIYAVLMRGILRKADEPISIFLITALVCGYGSLSGGAVLLSQKGITGITEVPDPAWYIAALAGATSFFAIWLKSLAFRYSTAGKVAIFSVVQMIFGAVLGMIFYQEPSDWLIWTAITLTVAGICLTARSK